MGATFFGLEIGKRAIFAQRGQIDVTSHNIANLNTEGYSRQRAVLGTVAPVYATNLYAPLSDAQFGGGVDIAKVQNFRDSFIDAKILRERSSFEKNTASNDMLKQVEDIMNEPGEASLRDQFDTFWASWQSLSQSPATPEMRRVVIQDAENLTSYINDLDERLRKLQGDFESEYEGSIQNQLESAVKEVNSIAKQIAGLNVEIEKVETSNGSANDLRDRRENLLEDLSKLVNVETLQDTRGHMIVRVGRHTLVQHSDTKDLNLARKDGDTFPSLSSNEDYTQFTEKPEIAEMVIQHTADYQNYTLSVAQLAQAQKSRSYLTFHPTDSALSNFGISSGTFKVNDREFSMDSTKTSLQDLEKMVNAAGINVIAKVSETGQFLLESALTGKDNNIKFENGTSNITTILDMREETSAQDAIFTINGVQYQTAENTSSKSMAGVTIILKKVGTTNVDLRPIVTDGKIRGLLEVRDGAIQTLRDQLDELAYNLVVEVNGIHREGFGLDGVSGRNFFQSMVTDDQSNPYKDAAKKISMESFILNDVNKIAAAEGVYENEGDRLPTYTGEGDGSNAIKIASLKNSFFFMDGKASFHEFTCHMITQVGASSQQAENSMKYTDALMTQLEAKRSETMGVSLDEEMANLIKFQQSYNAAAKVISIVDEMLDKIINGMI
ncbi:MAG: flagellar hook-associated protein FlgK [Candidatus Riflebacteria bacterium]|nr:flagellar hook-associated protein FlgK [Candidatus Riflebacteria bacterium]